DYWGEAIVACVALHPGAQCDAAELARFCEQNLSGYKRPKRYRFFEELPKTSTGKIQKHVLRERAAGEEKNAGSHSTAATR
ncbi:MAG: hypothetical protein ACHP78_18710, partial [Terriglobales bacterium]